MARIKDNRAGAENEPDQECISGTVAKWQALGLVAPFDLMNFRLTYEGPLVASGSNSAGRIKEKWTIRKKIQPQLAELWATHPVLKGIGLSGLDSSTRMDGGIHLSSLIDIKIGSSARVAAKLLEPVIIGGHNFVPLVRKSLELACGLDILFLRKELPGSLILQGGDIDNRIKTLFDALKMPSKEDIKVEQPDADPFFCLMEDDALVTNFSVDTDRLLATPGMPANQVYLVIEVTVKVMRITDSNVGFLGD